MNKSIFFSFSIRLKYAFSLTFDLNRSALSSKSQFSTNTNFIVIKCKLLTLFSQIKFHWNFSKNLQKLAESKESVTVSSSIA